MTITQLDLRLPSSCRLAGTRIPAYMFRTYQEIAQQAAATIAQVIRDRNGLGHAAVLGLVTGSTPIQVYRELIRLHREEGLDFSNVVTFNLSEFVGLKCESDQSLRRWMEENFFKHVNIPAENIHFLDGAVSLAAVDEHCRDFERQIEQAGGIDVALLGIGRNGHLAFNEPFSVRNSRTRLARLDPITRRDAGSSFFQEENVPTSCLTAGLSTIFAARKIILVALGEHKAEI
ncbi:MAG TPA: 6-phosphogluconolactonase, partial [Pirellulales bacterium]